MFYFRSVNWYLKIFGTSFYPIFPPPHDLSAEVNLDMTHIDGGRMVDDESDLDYAPDVLILPSRFKQFSKVCSSHIEVMVVLGLNSISRFFTLQRRSIHRSLPKEYTQQFPLHRALMVLQSRG